MIGSLVRTKDLHGRELLLAGACTWLLLGCSAHVTKFAAAPAHICPGDQVEIEWSVVGSATLAATPPVAGIPNGPVDEQGHVSIKPAAPTDIVLKVTRFLGSPSGAQQTIELSKLEPLTASVGDADATPGCADGKVWATVHAKRFAPGMKVTEVSAHDGDGRTYEVEHAGKRATIAPGTPSSAFAGTEIGGDWLLTAALLPGQVCKTPTVPRNVVIDARTQCQ